MSAKEFYVNGFKTTIIHKSDFEAVGYTRPVNLDGVSIPQFIKELTENGQMSKLYATLQAPQQIWVCLSHGESDDGFDCRCTVCVFNSHQHDYSHFEKNELFTIPVPASEWADFEVGKSQSPTELHKHSAYSLVEKTGYTFNGNVGLHFDNEHEWEPGKKMNFLLPVIPV